MTNRTTRSSPLLWGIKTTPKLPVTILHSTSRFAMRDISMTCKPHGMINQEHVHMSTFALGLKQESVNSSVGSKYMERSDTS